VDLVRVRDVTVQLQQSNVVLKRPAVVLVADDLEDLVVLRRCVIFSALQVVVAHSGDFSDGEDYQTDKTLVINTVIISEAN
jgi:hypothetical protein